MSSFPARSPTDEETISPVNALQLKLAKAFSDMFASDEGGEGGVSTGEGMVVVRGGYASGAGAFGFSASASASASASSSASVSSATASASMGAPSSSSSISSLMHHRDASRAMNFFSKWKHLAAQAVGAADHPLAQGRADGGGGATSPSAASAALTRSHARRQRSRSRSRSPEEERPRGVRGRRAARGRTRGVRSPSSETVRSPGDAAEREANTRRSISFSPQKSSPNSRGLKNRSGSGDDRLGGVGGRSPRTSQMSRRDPHMATVAGGAGCGQTLLARHKDIISKLTACSVSDMRQALSSEESLLRLAERLNIGGRESGGGSGGGSGRGSGGASKWSRAWKNGTGNWGESGVGGVGGVGCGLGGGMGGAAGAERANRTFNLSEWQCTLCATDNPMREDVCSLCEAPKTYLGFARKPFVIPH